MPARVAAKAVCYAASSSQIFRFSTVLAENFSSKTNVNFRTVNPYHVHRSITIAYRASNCDKIFQNVSRGFHTSGTLDMATKRFIPGKSHESTTKLRGKLFDDSDNVQENLDALTTTQLSLQEDTQTKVDESFQLYPDETTADQLFNGIKLVITSFCSNTI